MKLIPTSSSAKTILASVLSVLPTGSKAVLPLAAAVSTFAVSGCSTKETKIQFAANERAIYHVKLANAYDELVSIIANNIDNYNVDEETKNKILDWKTKLDVARKELYSAFNNGGTTWDQVKNLGSKKPTLEQEKAHYNYRVTAMRAYFEGLGGKFYELNHNPDIEPFKTFDNRVDKIIGEDSADERSLMYLRNGEPNFVLPWGYREPIGTELGDYGGTTRYEVDSDMPHKMHYLDFHEKLPTEK